jgi:E3 ubiquitin-protein ligase RAD18
MTDPDPSDSISDSTDWLSTPLPGLTPVESALRCEVCKDFYRTPMLTSCNHTFCSLCIRRALANEGKCPLCRASDQEMRLRSNWSMEEVVTAFMKTRAALLVLAQQPASLASGSATPKRRLEEDQTVDDPRGSKRLRHSARLSAARGAETMAEMARQEAYIPAPPQPEEPDDGLVACPICLQRMKEALVDRHIDTACPGSPQPQPRSTKHSRDSRSTTPTGLQPVPKPARVLERLPPLNYSMLKEPQLRRKLGELGISSLGSRQMLERRHREWITIWNANCDSLHPRRKTELLHDLDTWERTSGSRAPTMSRSAAMGAQIKDKDFDQAAWSTKHDTSFKDLIASARRSREQARQKNQEGAEEGEQNSGGPQGSAQRSYAATPEAVLETPPEAVDSARGTTSSPGSHAVARKTDVVDLTVPIKGTPSIVKDVPGQPYGY